MECRCAVENNQPNDDTLNGGWAANQGNDKEHGKDDDENDDHKILTKC